MEQEKLQFFGTVRIKGYTTTGFHRDGAFFSAAWTVGDPDENGWSFCRFGMVADWAPIVCWGICYSTGMSDPEVKTLNGFPNELLLEKNSKGH